MVTQVTPIIATTAKDFYLVLIVFPFNPRDAGVSVYSALGVSSHLPLGGGGGGVRWVFFATYFLSPFPRAFFGSMSFSDQKYSF